MVGVGRIRLLPLLNILLLLQPAEVSVLVLEVLLRRGKLAVTAPAGRKRLQEEGLLRRHRRRRG